MGPTTLLETKFFLPQVRVGAVARPRLDEQLRTGSRLVLVSAPAGFGKTTLVGSWLSGLAESGTRVAWVSLDEADRDPDSFWTYLLTALDRAVPGTGSAGLTSLGAGQPIEAALAAVLNELSVRPDDVVLVLDDYHLAETSQLRQGMTFLADRLPPQVRLVITTRADPTLPLARMRARGELTEVRAADLRFTEAETSAFLTAETGRSFDPTDVTALGHRTEGWIASLQLAALSLRDRPDASAFIAGFAGDDRHVVDYLVEEVLAQEPDEVRDFLVETAILDRLTATLCDAVTLGADGAAMLESLERRNLFVVPLDDQRRWYRYHHLFADVLRARLKAERPDVLPELHRRASDWYAGNDQHEEAVRHALAAGDPARAADLVELAIPQLRRERRESLLHRWASELPDELVRHRPVLAIGLVGGLMASNDFTGVAARLADVDQMLSRPRSEVVVLDEAELARVPAAVEMYRAALSLISGDLADAIKHADQAEAESLEGDHLTRAAASGLAGLARWAAGDITGAHRAYTACADGLTRADHIADVLGCSLTLADMELALGRLSDAEATLEGALALADQHGARAAAGSGAPGMTRPPVLRGSADMLVGLSRVAWHRNDLGAAAELLRRADILGESAGLPQHPYRWRVALARLRAADQDYAGAVALLDEAERVYVGDFSPQVHPIHATRARVLLAAGGLDAVAAWAADHHLASDDDLSYLREYEHLTLARLLIAQDATTREAADLLNRVLAAATGGGRFGTVIEVEVLRARAYASAGDEESALAALEHALDLAEPDGWVRYFVDAGSAMEPLLRAIAVRRPGSSFARRLVSTWQDSPILAADSTEASRPSSALRDTGAATALPDPLSDRELEVLRLLASELDGPGIARELVVSLNTVRTHTKHIYTKLDVNNRRSAVARAHQLGLLSRSARA